MKRYKNPPGPSRVGAAAVMLAVSVGLWTLAGIWYTAARRPYLTAQETAVSLSGAEDMNADPPLMAEYGVLSAARALDSRGDTTGYLVVSVKNGYKSPIRVQSTFSADGSRLAAIRILSHNETEYLGDRIATEGFTAPFSGRLLPVKLWQSAAVGSPVDGLSGSTVSAQAVVGAVNNAHAFLLAYLAA